MAIQKLCKISSIEKLNTDAVSIWLEAGELVQAAQVGQFVNIKCGEGLLLRRPHLHVLPCRGHPAERRI